MKMKKIHKISDSKKTLLAKVKSFPALQSVGDDASSYKGNQLHNVISFTNIIVQY